MWDRVRIEPSATESGYADLFLMNGRHREVGFAIVHLPIFGTPSREAVAADECWVRMLVAFAEINRRYGISDSVTVETSDGETWEYRPPGIFRHDPWSHDTSRQRTAMKTWEVDVEVRVRKTLFILGGRDEETVRALAQIIVRDVTLPDEVSMFVKWTDGLLRDVTLPDEMFVKWTGWRHARCPMPVETIIDNDPRIVAVREIP
jgi:hypothetical protein